MGGERKEEKGHSWVPRGGQTQGRLPQLPLGLYYPRPRSSTKPVLGMRCSKKGDVLNTFCELETL